MTAAAGVCVGSEEKCDGGSVNNESAQLMMTALDHHRMHQRTAGNDHQGLLLDRSMSSPVEPTYADVMMTSSSTAGARRRSDDTQHLPAFPRHQLQVLGLLGASMDIQYTTQHSGCGGHS